MHVPAYSLVFIVGLILSAALWRRRMGADPLLALVYAAALLGALVGAKLGYLAAEFPFHWHDENRWRHLLVGKTILGGLLGGYLGAEAGKKLIGHRVITGDAFALIVPPALALGRVGCVLHGCCTGAACDPAWYTVADDAGVHRWPAPIVEGLFHVVAFFALWRLHRRGQLRGQLFHVYLIAYGLFRMAHEPLRDTPRIGPVSTYQLLAALLVAFATWRFVQRRRAMAMTAQGALPQGERNP